MAEIKLHKSPWRGIKLIAMASVFVAIGIWMIMHHVYGTTNYIMGWVCTCFFGLAILIGFFVVFDRRPQIVINENGIWDRTTRQNQIKWEQILGAYPINIYGQKFISIAVNEDFVFQKRKAKWITKMNKAIGVQEINLNLSQIRIEEHKFIDLINAIRKTDKKERNSIIRNFNSAYQLNSEVDFTKYLYYVLIVIVAWSLSIYDLIFFWCFLGIMGVSALIAKWFTNTTNNSKLRKYAEKITYLGFINLVLFFFTIKIYDYTAESVGKALTKEIENYKTKHNAYPKEISSIKNSTDFNFIQQMFANKVQYNFTEEGYSLEINYLNNSQKEFNAKLNEWY